MEKWKRFFMGEVGVDWGDGDADELQDRVKRSMNSSPHADGEKRSGAIESKSEEPKIDMYSEGSVASEGIETESPHVGGRKEIEQIEDDAVVASQGGYTRSKSSTGPQEFRERQTFKTGEPNVGVSAANPCEEQVDEAPREERLLNGSVTKSGEPADESSIEGSFMQGAGAGPKIEYFCAPNQHLTSDTWKIFFYHMLPFTTLPPLFMLACLWWAYREWGWSALLFCTTISALLSVSTPIYSRKFREYVADYFYGLLARYVPRAQYVVPEKPFPEDRPYIFACHPHGRMFYSTIIFCQLHSIWRKNILQKGDLFMTAAGVFFFVPLIRNLFYLVGVIPVEEADIVAKLKHKDHVTILIGGVKEVLLGTEDDIDRLYLKRRKGFCRIAVQQKAGVVPVYFFNENQMFMHNSKSFLRFWERVNKYVKVGVPFMRGRFLILPMPFRRPLMIAVGDPLFPREEESVNEFHERYMKALRELFDRYVPFSPNPNTKLVIQ